jgi:phosphoglycolate phosphatase-like HAD superfamily hydrolase
MNMKEPIHEKELKWLGIDFDLTIAHNSEHPEYQPLEPIKGAKKYLDKLVADGWKIIIYTSRPWHEYDKIEEWLNLYQIPFRRIVCGKLFVKWMVDDRAINFNGNWEEVYKQII